MDRATAQGLAGGGALLVAVSLVLPWYALEVDRAGAAGLGVTGSGWETLGVLRFVVLGLALVMGWRATQSVAGVAAVGLLVLVGLRFSSPPGVEDLMIDALPSGTDPLLTALARPMLADAVEQAGVSLAPAWGMAVAAAGAAMGVAGSLGYVGAGAPSRETSAA